MQKTDERLLIAENKPELSVFDTVEFNAETPTHLLHEEVTPLRHLFVRNTGRLPAISSDEIAAWTLSIDGAVERATNWTVAQLQGDFETVTQTAVIECAGNGRAFFTHPTGEPLWTHGAVGCVRWTGVRLRDLLAVCRLRPEAIYTGHYAPDETVDGRWPAISRGIPIEKAIAPETMLAFAANGEALPFFHGGPLRLVVPGYPGSAWQKWLNRIVIRDREHDGPRMTGLHYRLPRRPVRPDERIDEALFDVITDMPVKSVITFPNDGFRLPAGSLTVRGNAWSGHIALAAMEISTDGGHHFRPAQLAAERERFAWRSFEFTATEIGQGPVEIVARATDVAGNSQPLESVPWNPRGYCNNMAHRIRGTIV